MKKLIHEPERYQQGIVGLADVRWSRIGETTIKEGHMLMTTYYVRLCYVDIYVTLPAGIVAR